MKKTLTVEVDEAFHHQESVHTATNKITRKEYIVRLVTKDLEKHSTPANNGNLHSSLDEACKEEKQD